jgi:hypothetical protein
MVRKNNWSASGFGKYVSPDLVQDKFLDVEIVILMQGDNLFGDPIYSYLLVTGRNLKEMFAKMQRGENFMPSDYGTVVAAGRGDPPQEVRDEIALTYKMIDVPMPRPKKPVFSQPKFFGDEENY